MDNELIKKLAGTGISQPVGEVKEYSPQNQEQGSDAISITDKIPGLTEEKYKEIRLYVQSTLQQRFNPEQTSNSRDPAVRSQLRSIVMRSLIEKDIPLGDSAAQVLVEELGNDLLGFGPLEPFFYDPEVTEIKATCNKIQVEKHGVMKTVEGVRFKNEEHIRDVLERMLAPTGRKIEMANPEVNARLFDGSRLIAQIPPYALHGTYITIRRFRQDMTVGKLLQTRVLSPELLKFLKAAVISRMNIIVSGGTSSGKTTVLNCLASFIPENEFIITVEDPAELQLQHPNVWSLEANAQTDYTQQRAVVSALRMRPDRIILGECRFAETFDMLQAMNTGHIGSMTSAHSNSAWLLRERLVNMVQMARLDIPHEAIVGLVSDATDIFIHSTRDKTGRRRIDHVCEVVGAKKNEEGILNIELNTLWQYNEKKDTFDYVAKYFKRQETFIEKGGWAA